MGRKETCRCSDWCGMSGGGAGSQSIDQRGADEGRGFRGANNLFSAFTAMIGACHIVIVTAGQVCQLLDWMFTGWWGISLLIPRSLEVRRLGLRHFHPRLSPGSLEAICADTTDLDRHTWAWGVLSLCGRAKSANSQNASQSGFYILGKPPFRFPFSTSSEIYQFD